MTLELSHHASSICVVNQYTHSYTPYNHGLWCVTTLQQTYSIVHSILVLGNALDTPPQYYSSYTLVRAAYLRQFFYFKICQLGSESGVGCGNRPAVFDHFQRFSVSQAGHGHQIHGRHSHCSRYASHAEGGYTCSKDAEHCMMVCY